MLIKSPDDKSKRLKLLQELQQSEWLDERQRDWLRDQYWRLKPGVDGERDAAYFLDASFSGSKNHAVLHDLRIEADGKVAQVDHLVMDRLLTFFLLETKAYRGSLNINEHGEFTAIYDDGRQFGIESPLEQSRRHESVLKSVLERLEITGRGGLAPRFVHVVMVHPKAIIQRPPADKFDTSMVIKADQFATWHKKYMAKIRPTEILGSLINIRGRNTVNEWAERLKAEHCPISPLDLPDFMKPKKQSATVRSVIQAPRAAKPAAVVAAGCIASADETNGKVCAECGKSLTPKAVKYCRDNVARFNNKLYCFQHQRSTKSA
jgi:hypothetical protein